MRKTFAVLAIAALSVLAITPSADAQPRPATPSFGQAFRAGAGFSLGQRVGLGGGFYGAQAAPFGFRQSLAFRGGGFYGHGSFRQPFFGDFHGGAQFRQQLFFRQSYYSAPLVIQQPLIVPQPLIAPEPICAPQALAVPQGCGTLGLGAGYGFSSFGLAGSCGHPAAFRVAPLRFRDY